ncbi:hypothetical protein SteCoe_29046 [Stentor coeruleus]|uniref:EF-hand domain-containing protein n=1 Tax=Stentor coeruleus TaxID=5963 RepID=A0A1R2B6S3_9CILI|nr:hypothetical protein SteCoe_29046 [Stentor coeruleus]
MGCNCTSNRRVVQEINEPAVRRFQTSLQEKITKMPQTNSSLKPECPYSHCNLLVWTETLDEYKRLFPKSFIRINITPEFEMTFNIISTLAYNESSLLVIDCLIFIINSPQEVEKILKISFNYMSISIQIAISEHKLQGLGNIILIPEISELYTQLYAQQANLEKLLREIFYEMDENFDNTISKNEFHKALLKLDISLTADKIEEIMQELDTDKDSKISFNEFSYWWKRGRQKKKSLLQLTFAWAEHIRNLLPRMNKFSEKKQIDKGKIAKKIIVVIGSPDKKNIVIKIKAGKSAKREEILRSPEEKLRLNIYEYWIAVSLKGKTEAALYQHLRKFEDMLVNVKASILAGTLKGTDSLESVQHRIMTIDNQLMFSFNFEINTEVHNGSTAGQSTLENKSRSENEIKTSFSQSIFDYFIKPTPIDDNISISLTSSKTGMQHLENPGTDFLNSLENSEIIIEAEHWSAYGKLIIPESKFDEVLKEFALFEGVKVIKDPESIGLQPLIFYLRRYFKPLQNVCNQIAMVQEVLDAIEESFEHEVSFFIRYLNFGIEISIRCSDLVNLIKSL